MATVGYALLLTAAHAGEATQSGISGIIVEVPRSTGIFTLKLKTTVYKPAGDGPSLFIVLSHGKARGKTAFQARAHYSEQAAALVACDYVVVIPMRQGFAKSDGAYTGSSYNVEANGIIQAEDVVATLDYMTAQPYVNRNRIVVMGRSHGNLTTLTFGTIAYPGVCGLMNFAGGLRNDTYVDWKDSLVRTFEAYDRQSRYPSFWFYGDNDNYWPKPIPDRVFTAYTSAGRKGRPMDFDTLKGDLHGMFASHAGLGIWLPQVDAFLRELGLPTGPMRTMAPGSSTEASDADDLKSDINKDPE